MLIILYRHLFPLETLVELLLILVFSLTAEKFLESVEGSQNYPLLLLTLLEKSQENVIKVCASVTFKNYIKRNWRIVSIQLSGCTKIICFKV